jgi:hypothetical protein
MCKDWWFLEYERIGDELAFAEITREEAIDRWVNMGLNRDEAESTADVALGLEP